MAQHISKSALVAEIEKLKGKVSDGSSYWNGWQHALRMIELSLNTIETKDVDLEKEVKNYIYTLPHSRTGIPGGWKCSWNEEEVIKIVKHFLKVK